MSRAKPPQTDQQSSPPLLALDPSEELRCLVELLDEALSHDAITRLHELADRALLREEGLLTALLLPGVNLQALANVVLDVDNLREHIREFRLAHPLAMG